MPSLRKKVVGFMRQLSISNLTAAVESIGHGENSMHQRSQPGDGLGGCFITRYLNGLEPKNESPVILHGRNPEELPSRALADLDSEEHVLAAVTGPDRGLTSVNLKQRHLSISDPDVDYIDILEQSDPQTSVNTSMDCIFSVAHDRWLVIRTKETSSLCPIDNSGVKIRAAGKLYEPESKYTMTNENMNVKFAEGAADDDDPTVRIKSNLVNANTNGDFFEGSSLESLNDNDNDQSATKIDLVLRTASDNTLDNTDDTGSASGCDDNDDNIIPPPSDFANDMIPLRKSKSAPAPFKKTQGAASSPEIAGVADWFSPDDMAYGVATTLYEKNPTTNVNNGEPIADCFAVATRPHAAVLTLADGVNWGPKASIAARSAVHGSMDYLNKALFSSPLNNGITTTRDVFIALLRSFHAAHALILQEQGMLTTLTVCAVLPLAANTTGPTDIPNKYVACTCNVGDSLAYVYSKKSGVREITRGSHDIHCMRDMRDALGALGPVDGCNPELNNLTLAMTEVEAGDIVFLTSDGISDNFDPVVGKFAILPNARATSARGAKSDGQGRQSKQQHHCSRRADQVRRTNSAGHADGVGNDAAAAGLPIVEAYQRHELTLLRMEDLLRRGVSGDGPPCQSAKKLCELLLDFAIRITAAKRRILEDVDLYYSQGKDGQLVQLSKLEQRSRRKKMLDKMSMVPGKLDHATVVACAVGSCGAAESNL